MQSTFVLHPTKSFKVGGKISLDNCLIRKKIGLEEKCINICLESNNLSKSSKNISLLNSFQGLGKKNLKFVRLLYIYTSYLVLAHFKVLVKPN